VESFETRCKITAVVIRASSGRQIDALIAELSSPNALTRDGAVARLTVIGERAVPRLLAIAAQVSAGPETRVAALHALDGIGDLRALEPALAALEPERDRAVRLAARRGPTAKTARWLAARGFATESIEAVMDGVADDEGLELG